MMIWDNRAFESGEPGSALYAAGDNDSGRVQLVSGRASNGDRYVRNIAVDLTTNGGTHIISAAQTFLAGTAAGRSALHFDGGAEIRNNDLTTTITSANNLRVMLLGALNASAGATLHLTGKIGDVIFVNGVSATDRQRVEGYLAHKWGLTANLPSDHPFRNQPPYKE